MFRKLLLILSIALLAASCGGDKTTEQTTETVPTLTIAEYNANPDAYVDKTIELTGTVNHVCKHSGQRMFLIGDNPEDRVKIESGDKIAGFDVALEGNKVKVVGKGCITKIDAAYLDNWEVESCAAEAAVIEDQTKTADSEQSETKSQIDAMRKKLAESGKDYLGFYHVEAVSYEELH